MLAKVPNPKISRQPEPPDGSLAEARSTTSADHRWDLPHKARCLCDYGDSKMNDDKETEVLQTLALAWDMTLEEVRAELLTLIQEQYNVIPNGVDVIRKE
jgi:hypothetical protein